ncbi:MAG TPA: cupin domain-containing protein, partial [Beijerinckiaceae bacterium]|nr:cupin domain-containing protein [Beijerinckiaceae bacterium]
MTAQLGTLEELPADYRQSMEGERVSPLWPMMRNVLPHDRPNPVTKPALWSFERIRPLLLKAGELTPVEKAERRVLVLNDPGRGKGAMQVTSSIYVGLQLLLPGEKAPAHKHTPSAARIVVEGEGAFTIVDGEKCAMERGDLILTPGGMWHDHGHDGTEPVIWLDALDLPLFVFLEGSYAEEGELQAPRNRPDASQVEYSQPGLVPARGNGGERRRYPLLRFPWRHTEKALRAQGE